MISVIRDVRTGGNGSFELSDRLRRDLQASIAAEAPLAPTAVVKLISIDAKWVMEGGRVISEPGEKGNLEGVREIA